MAASKTINSVDRLIEELGGLSATARVFNTTPQAVWNWRARKRGLPMKQHYAHQQILKRHGLKAPASLWGFAEAAEQ